MILIVATDAAQAAANAAQWIASALREDIAARGVATLAVSGGNTPRPMLQALARETLPWRQLRRIGSRSSGQVALLHGHR